MVNLRPRPKSDKTKAPPRAPVKRESTAPALSSQHVDLSEATLQRLNRGQLQQLAKTHRIPANIKSVLIIQRLLAFGSAKRKRTGEDDEEVSRKKLRGCSSELTDSPSSESDVAPAPIIAPKASHLIANPEAEAGPSDPRSGEIIPSPTRTREPRSTTSSTEEKQSVFDSLVSSRRGTPPPAEPGSVARSVTIMQEIAAQDAELTSQIEAAQRLAEEFRQRARRLRDLAKADRSRRERMENYFLHWRDMEPKWDRSWFGDGPESKASEELEEPQLEQQQAEDVPVGVATIPVGEHDQTARLNGRAARPILPEEQMRRKQAIIAVQEAGQRELEALERQEQLVAGDKRE